MKIFTYAPIVCRGIIQIPESEVNAVQASPGQSIG